MGGGEVVRRDVGEAPMHFAGQASSVQVQFCFIIIQIPARLEMHDSYSVEP